ncbi:MAG: DUF305 domain-containing protein [Actinomycetota bacterium]|nr:DUF305 domain-containing protein [Actinomycetota bacterium]MDQ3438524.1 DUF305 domain-containing protein [Actinomycetota bacterium]
MKVLTRLRLPGLLLAIALVLASCGGNAGSSGGDQDGGMQGMDHGKSGGKTAHKGKSTGKGMASMDHGEMGSGNMSAMSRKMVMPNGKYSDAAFVDAMVPHHEGAVEMAQVALKNAEHAKTRRLAQNIIDSQRAEIKKLNGIRENLNGPVMKMSGEDMSMMGMMKDPQQLADEDPFDRAFIDNMIPHHESAIAMAEVALQKSKNPEIKGIAGDIVSAQKREIEEMKRWRKEWYPGS